MTLRQMMSNNEAQIAAMEAALTDDWQDAMTIAAKAGVGRSRVATMIEVARSRGWGWKTERSNKGSGTKYVFRRPETQTAG